MKTKHKPNRAFMVVGYVDKTIKAYSYAHARKKALDLFKKCLQIEELEE